MDFPFKLIPMNREGQGPVPKIILADLGSKEPVYLRTCGSARSRAHLKNSVFTQSPQNSVSVFSHTLQNELMFGHTHFVKIVINTNPKIDPIGWDRQSSEGCTATTIRSDGFL